MFFIVLKVKNAGIPTDEVAQTLLIYEYMDKYLKRDLPRPFTLSTVLGLIEKFRYQKIIWFDIYGRHEITKNN